MAKRGSSVWRGGERRRVASDEATSAALGSELRAPELCEDEGEGVGEVYLDNMGQKRAIHGELELTGVNGDGGAEK